MIIILTILVELAFIATLILFLYRLKFRLGLAPLYMLIGANQLFQTILSTRFDLEILGGFSIYISPTIIFSAGLFAILLIYIKEGVQTTQRFIFAIILANLSLTGLSIIFNWQEIAMTDKASILFYPNFRVLAAGIISLILDAFILVILYEFFFAKVKWLNLFSRLALTLLIILNFDSLLFVTISFWEKPDYSSKLVSHMFGKSIAALFFATVLWLYLRYLDKDKKVFDESSEKRGKEDIFSILTYKGKFEKLQTEKAISEKLLQGIISEKTGEQNKAIRRFTILSSVRELRIDKFSSTEQTKEFLVKVKEAFEVDGCVVHLVHNKELVLLSSVGIDENKIGNELSSDNPYLNEVISKKKSLTIEDSGSNRFFNSEMKNELKEFPFKSCAGAPLLTGDNVIGVLCLLTFKSKRSFSNLEMEHLQIVAKQIAHSLENSKLFEQNERHKEVLVKQMVARKKAETEIIHSNERFELVGLATNEALWEWNLETNKVWGNETHQNLYGLTMADPVPDYDEWKKRIHPEDRDRMIKTVEEMLASNRKSFVAEYQFRSKSNEWIHVYGSTFIERNKEGKPIRLVGSMMDITERKKGEKAIIESEEKFRTLIQQAADGIFLVDAEGNYLEANESASLITGYSIDELKKMNAQDIIETEDLKKKPIRVEEIKKGHTVYVERIVRRKDNVLINVDIKAKLMDNGKVIVILRDITERKAEQEQIKSSNEQLRQLTGHLQTIREEERSRIGQEIHDQLGQHLTVVKMDVSRLKKNIPAGKNKEEDLVEILSELDNCMQMVRKISSDLRPSIIDDLGIIAALEWQAEDFEKRTEISTKFYSNVTELKLPSIHLIGLFRIFQESLTNVARHAEAKEVVVVLNKENGFVVMTITDNGKGFDKNSVSGKRSMGLFGMRERTLLMNGEYEINSEPGKGTEVRVVVPFI